MWVRVHDQLWQDDKVLELVCLGERGLAAIGVFVMGVGWTHHARQDGRIPKAALPQIHGTPKHAALLVKVGLWQVSGNGWLICAYDKWQDTTDEIEQARVAKAQAGRLAACQRWHSQPCDDPTCPGFVGGTVVDFSQEVSW